MQASLRSSLQPLSRYGNPEPCYPYAVDHSRRIGLLRRRLTKAGLPGLLVTHLPDLRYLSGFTGSSAALAVTRRAARLFTDGRYTTQAAEEVKAAQVQIVSSSPAVAAVEWLAAQVGVTSAGFDATHATVAELARWRSALPSKLRTLDVPYLLGQAHLELREPLEAAAEFQSILDNRGVDAVSPLFPLAYLGLARALRMHGDLRECRAAYEQLFAFWKDADADNPMLVHAQAEYAALGESVSATPGRRVSLMSL